MSVLPLDDVMSKIACGKILKPVGTELNISTCGPVFRLNPLVVGGNVLKAGGVALPPTSFGTSVVGAVLPARVEPLSGILARQSGVGSLDEHVLRTVTRTDDHETSDEDEVSDLRVRGPARRGSGQPMRVHIGGCTRWFTDGAGLCSSGPWHLERRQVSKWRPCIEVLRQLKHLIVSRLPVKKLVCDMAVGRCVVSPFDDVRREACDVLINAVGPTRVPVDLVPNGQCLRLPLIGELLRLLDHRDWCVY